MRLSPNYPLTTDRLILRPPEPDDAPAIVGYKSDPEVTRYLPHGQLNLDDVLSRITRNPGHLDDEQAYLNLAVLRRADQVLVGDVILMWQSREHRGGEIGYVFDPAHSGHGYATEAAREILRLGFEDLGLHRIIARIDPRNDASRRVLQRLGMRHEAHMLSTEFLQGEWTDEDIYAVLEDEWRASLASGHAAVAS